MSLSDEIELKLDVAPDCAATIAELPELAGITPVTRHQSATYFDTPDQDLRRAGMSLRVRRTGDRWVQTIKAESSTATGLFARHEWERDVAGGWPELDGVDEPLSRYLAKRHLERIAAAFTTEIVRTSWIVTFGGAEMELVLDRGEIAADGRAEPVSEIEIELREGDPAALFALARRVAAKLPARLGVITKSERGYRLLSGEAPRAVKTALVAIDDDMTAADAFRAIVRSCLRQYRLNETLLLATRRAAPLHHARVALRRLRSALSMFRPMIADERLDGFRTALRALAGRLGEARNLDVLIGRTPDGPLGQRLREARERACDQVCAMLSGPDTRALILDLAEWITAGPWLAIDATAELRDRRAERFARDLLDRSRRRVKRGGKRLAQLDDEARHEVRIQAKKLRYATEFFAGLYPAKPAPRRRRALLAALDALQSRLGELNDHATGVEVLRGLGITDKASLSHLAAPADRRQLLADAEDAYDALIDVKRFWR